MKLFDTFTTVTLIRTDLVANELILTTFDSAQKNLYGKTIVKVPVLSNGQLQIGGKKDQWCLGYQYCFYFIL